MNWEQVEGKWDQVKGKVREQWGKLTDDDLLVIKGKKDLLVGKLKDRYGYAKDRAEKEVESFASTCNCDSSCSSSNARDSRRAGNI